MLTCTDVLALVHSELGQPPIQVVAPSAGPRTLRDALEAARRHADGGLLVLLGADERAVTMARTMLVAGRRPELFVAGCSVELHVDGTVSELDGAVPEVVRRFGEGVVPGVEPDLLAEVVLNALLHRNWAIEAPVRVALAGERLVVISPGAIVAGAPPRAAHPNPLLVHFATALGLATGTGRGLRDVARRLARIRQRPLPLVERPGEVWFVADVRRPSPSRRPPKATSSPSSTPPSPRGRGRSDGRARSRDCGTGCRAAARAGSHNCRTVLGGKCSALIAIDTGLPSGASASRSR